MSNFDIKELAISDVYLIETKRYGDERGYFMETYRESALAECGLQYHFVQQNQSASQKGVLRGLHFQRTCQQAKLVRVLSGEVFDVAVDLRRGSASFGQWLGVPLSAENRRQLLIPRGFAHGFLVLSEHAVFAYQCDEYYHPEDEGGIIWNDPQIAVAWPQTDGLLLSEKDRKYPTLAELGTGFAL